MRLHRFTQITSCFCQCVSSVGWEILVIKIFQGKRCVRVRRCPHAHAMLPLFTSYGVYVLFVLFPIFRFHFPTLYYIMVDGWTLWIVDTFSECEHRRKVHTIQEENVEVEKSARAHTLFFFIICDWVVIQALKENRVILST